MKPNKKNKTTYLSSALVVKSPLPFLLDVMQEGALYRSSKTFSVGRWWQKLLIFSLTSDTRVGWGMGGREGGGKKQTNRNTLLDPRCNKPSMKIMQPQKTEQT